MVRVYDNFEQALAWLRRKRRRYRLNNPDAADADWSTSDEEDDPDESSERSQRGDQTREMVVTQIVVMGITEITIHQVGRTKRINSPMG
jgi:hypothetical protein